MVLVPYEKGRQAKQRAILLFVLLLCVAGGLYGGYSMGIHDQTNAVSERDQLVIKKSELDKKIIELQEQVAIFKHGSELEKQATETVCE